jgi:hypothetical protein
MYFSFVASEDANIKVYSCLQGSVEASVSSHDQAVRGFCLNKKGDYLAMANGAGDVHIYKLKSDNGPLGRQYTGSNSVCIKSGVLSKDVCRDFSNGFALSMTEYNGDLLLAIPQADGSPMVLKRQMENDSEEWAELDPLATDQLDTVVTHGGKQVNLVAFSPNGRYLASADITGRILIWNMKTHDAMLALNCSSGELVAMKWGVQDGDNFIMVTSKNAWAKVDDVISTKTGLCPPTGMIIEDKVQSAEVASRAGGGTVVAVPYKDLKRIRKVGGGADAEPSDDEGDFEFSANADEVNHQIASRSVTSLIDKEALGGDSEGDDDDDMEEGIVEEEDNQIGLDANIGIAQFIQDPFQPSSTTPDEKKRRYMVWNSVGSIVSRDDDISNRIEIKFADMSSNNKQESFPDNYGFTIADMSYEGAVFAAPPDEPEQPDHIVEDGMPPPSKTVGSVIFYKSFGNKMRIGGANENFTHVLNPGEEAVAVCAGGGWCAVATSKNFLRVFSSTGLQLSITMLKGPVVCLCGYATSLAVIYNSSGCTIETPILLVDVFDISIQKSHQCLVKECVLPLGSRGTLAWAAFSEDRYLMALDSHGVLSALLCTLGWQWVPVMDTTSLCRTVDHKVWPVVVKSERFCYALLHGERRPSVFPQPVVSARPFKLPIVEGKEGKDKTESERTRDLMWRTIQVGHGEALRNYSEYAGGESVCGYTPTELEDQSFSTQLERDKLLIKLFHDCCKKQRISAALDVMSRITTLEGLRKAIIVANALGKANLARLLSDLIAEKEALEEPEVTAHPSTVSPPHKSQTHTSAPVSSYHPVVEEEDPYHYSSSQSQLTQMSMSGYDEMKSPGHVDQYDDSDRRVGSRAGGSVLAGAKRRGPLDGDSNKGHANLPVNKFAVSSIVSPFKKRRDAYESIDMKSSPSPKKPPLQVRTTSTTPTVPLPQPVCTYRDII